MSDNPTEGRQAGEGISVEEIERIAEEAVEKLEVANAIHLERKALFSRIEECDKFASGAPVNPDMMFLALSLPIANGLIHFATSRQALKEARDWVRNNWRDQEHEPDPVSTLAALTLIYIVEQGYKEYKRDRERKETWKRIKERVEKLVDTRDDDSSGEE